MMLFFQKESGKGKEEAVVQISSTLDQMAALTKTIQDNVVGLKPVEVFKNVEKQMISMSDKSIALQRNMGGVAANTGEFQKRLMNAYQSTLSIGATFDDVTGAVDGLAEGMGRMVSPSEITIKNMTVLSQVTGMSTKEIGKMTSELIRFGGTQEEAVKKMSDMAKEARIAGLNGKQFTEAISKNLSKVSGFGFKSGVDGMSRMVKQSMLLRTNVESIGALKMQDGLLEPEGAIQMAADFQMLGGAVGKLADPFQLMYMAQNDMEGLQNELVNSTKAAMSFNSATGKFDVSTQDMYRLRQQAKLTGANLEDLVNTGREAAKLDFIKEKFDLSNIGLKEDQQALISNLATIGEGGKLTVDIPGLGKPIVADNPEELAAALRTPEAIKALEEYNRVQGLDDRKLAENQLTISERQAADVNEIKFAVIASMSPNQRENFRQDIKAANEELGKTGKNVATTAAPAVAVGVSSLEKALREGASKAKFPTLTPQEQQENDRIQQESEDKYKTGDLPQVKTVGDMFMPAGGAPSLLNEGTLYKGIVGDEIAIGTNLSEAFNKSGKLNEMLSSIGSTQTAGANASYKGLVNDDVAMSANLSDAFNKSGKLNEILSSIGSTQNAGGNTSVNGKIDININLTGAISGDKNADVEKMFSDPRVQKQIMDTVLYKLDSYKRQQGVLS